MTGYDSTALAARAEIADVVHRYCHAIDRRRWWLMDSVFHDDATYRFGPIEGSWREFVAQAQALVDPLGPTHHQVSNILADLDGDRAQVETYLTAYHRVPVDYPSGFLFPSTGTPYDVLIGGRYVDRFERRNGVWRIAHRIGLFDWWHEQSAADGALPQTSMEARGRYGNDDPSAPVTARFQR